MRFLADENLPGEVVFSLKSLGHDVAWMLERAPGSDDRALLDIATAENRIILTLDKDFGELVFRLGLPSPCGIVLLRLRASSPKQFAQEAVRLIAGRDDWPGHFSVVNGDLIRMKRLPSPPRP